MSLQERIRFKSFNEWHNFINSKVAAKTPPQGQELLDLRNKCYEEIEQLRKRPLLIYAAKFDVPVQPNIIAPNSIDLGDIDGFTDLVNSIANLEEKCIDILIHSPGGKADATERIVNILRKRFEEVHFLIPHSAYSAATMLSLSGNSITLHSSATLGPIDPQINGIPARSIKRGFEKVKEILKKEGPEAIPAYIPLIQKYSIELLELCEDSEKLSKDLVTEWLNEYMFKGKENVSEKINGVVDYVSNYDEHLLHSRPLKMDRLKEFDIIIDFAKDELKDLLWEAHIMIDGFFGLTNFVKLYETRHGVSWGKQFQINIAPQQLPPVN